MTKPTIHTSPVETTEDMPTALYSHPARPQWGLAVRVDGRDRYDRFQFQDGELRKIAKSHAHLLREVDKPRDESDRIARNLTNQAGIADARADRGKESKPLIPFDDQIRLFLEDFDEGFASKKWMSKKRGEDAKRRLKRHRSAAVEQAQELLGDDQLASLLIDQRYDAVMARVSVLLDATNMVSKKDRKTLASLDERGRREAALALSEIVSDETPVDKAMGRWIKALSGARKGVSWALATAAPALLQPHRHVFVKRSAVAEQARWMAPRLKVKMTPTSEQYGRIAHMFGSVQTELEERELTPQDNLDVADFIWDTLRPAARKRIAKLPEPPKQSGVVLSGSPANEDASESDDDDAVEAA